MRWFFFKSRIPFLTERLRAGDAVARGAVETTDAIWTWGPDAVNLLDINFVIFSGRASNAFDLLSGSLRKGSSARLFGITRGEVQIVPARCGKDAGMLGAGYLDLDLK